MENLLLSLSEFGASLEIFWIFMIVCAEIVLIVATFSVIYSVRLLETMDLFPTGWSLIIFMILLGFVFSLGQVLVGAINLSGIWILQILVACLAVIPGRVSAEVEPFMGYFISMGIFILLPCMMLFADAEIGFPVIVLNTAAFIAGIIFYWIAKVIEERRDSPVPVVPEDF